MGWESVKKNISKNLTPPWCVTLLWFDPYVLNPFLPTRCSSTLIVSCKFTGSGNKKVSEEISTILKRSKSSSSKADKSIGGYYDKIIKSSKVGSDEALSQSQPVSSTLKTGAGGKSEKPKEAKSKAS